MAIFYTEEMKQKIHYLSAKECANACQFWLKAFGIRDLIYSRNYLDGTGFTISTFEDMPRWYTENNFAPLFSTFAPLGVHLSRLFTPLKAIVYLEKNFKCFHEALVLKKHNAYIEQIELIDGEKDSYAALNLCCNNKELLNQCIGIFQYKLQDLFRQLELDRYTLPINPPEFSQYKEKKETAVKTLDTNLSRKFYLTCNSDRIILSRREYECLKLLAHGKTAKEAAKIFHISPRTIEQHICHIKEKTRCFTRTQMKDLYWTNFG